MYDSSWSTHVKTTEQDKGEANGRLNHYLKLSFLKIRGNKEALPTVLSDILI